LTTIKFGCQLPQETDDFEKLSKIAEICERSGYDSIWAYDHLAPYWTRQGQAFECWALLAALSQRTKKIKLGSLVTNVNLRSPSLLAKITSTFDNLSKGRLILGLGTGDRMSRRELLSYGYKFANTDERLERLKETVLILKAMWTQDKASFDGRFSKLSEAINYPKPMQTPHPPIWIGGKHPKILTIVAEMADGWNYWGLERQMLERCSRRLSIECDRFGRDPTHITKSWAGPLSNLFKPGRRRKQIEEDIRRLLQSQTTDETNYFIASLGSRAVSADYEIFAEAVRTLK
jgi:alkanesulfonate monooxygenase SsuD/methylene tetrahydromethanopterin reductase-like flavin-dependent oxidoreductase (luciferase family)